MNFPFWPFIWFGLPGRLPNPKVVTTVKWRQLWHDEFCRVCKQPPEGPSTEDPSIQESHPDHARVSRHHHQDQALSERGAPSFRENTHLLATVWRPNSCFMGQREKHWWVLIGWALGRSLNLVTTAKCNDRAFSWAAANGGVTNGGLRGDWSPFLEIGRNRPFSPFFCLFHPLPEGAKSTWKIQKTEEKGLFPQISSDLLKPPPLKPPFAAVPL